MRSLLCESRCLLIRTIKLWVKCQQWTGYPVPQISLFPESSLINLPGKILSDLNGSLWPKCLEDPWRSCGALYRFLQKQVWLENLRPTLVAFFGTNFRELEISTLHHLFSRIPDCLRRPGLLETHHILRNHLDRKRNLCLQHYQMWVELFLCTFFGGRISFRMFIEDHLCLVATGLRHVFLSARKTVSRR